MPEWNPKYPGGVPGLILDTSVLDRITANLVPRAEMILTKIASDVERDARNFTVRVKIGAMKGGWTWAQERPLQRTMYNKAADYAIHHEFGTRFMSASPMLSPAIENNRENFFAAFRELTK